MQRDLDAFARPFDILVIGAGIHGACIARLAAIHGFDVALLDRGDFGAATSRNSAKLLHGGIRYLQHFDVSRIRESIAAQRSWFRFAPHLVRPLRVIIPTYGHGTRGPMALGAAVTAFDLIAGGRNDGVRDEIRMPGSGVMRRRRLVAEYPELERDGVTGGAWWHDGQMLDATRLTLECVWDAVEARAAAANHLECVALLHDAAGVHGAAVRDRLSGREFEIRAKLTVNATGPWVDRILNGGPRAVRGLSSVIWTRNMNLVTRSLHAGSDALGIASERASDAAIGKSKRLFFASPWHGCTVVGTTHDMFDDDPDRVIVADEAVAEFLQEVRDAAPRFRLEPSDVRSVHVGLTPAEDGVSERAKRSLLVDHEAAHQVPGLVTVAGIKYTTAPVVAIRTLDLACRKLGRAVMRRPLVQAAFGAPARTLMPLPDEQNEARRHADDELSWASRIYGTRADQCLASAGAAGESVADRVFRSRVRFGIAHEMVGRLSDSVLRATDLAERGLLTAAQMNWCAETLSSVFGWAPGRLAQELDDTRADLEKLRIRLAG